MSCFDSVSIDESCWIAALQTPKSIWRTEEALRTSNIRRGRNAGSGDEWMLCFDGDGWSVEGGLVEPVPCTLSAPCGRSCLYWYTDIQSRNQAVTCLLCGFLKGESCLNNSRTLYQHYFEDKSCSVDQIQHLYMCNVSQPDHRVKSSIEELCRYFITATNHVPGGGRSILTCCLLSDTLKADHRLQI